MEDALTIILAFAGFAAGVLVVARAARKDPEIALGRQLLDTGPTQPCWTEEIGREGALRLGRGQCVHDMLMELDARAARGDFPVRELNQSSG